MECKVELDSRRDVKFRWIPDKILLQCFRPSILDFKDPRTYLTGIILLVCFTSLDIQSLHLDGFLHGRTTCIFLHGRTTCIFSVYSIIGADRQICASR